MQWLGLVLISAVGILVYRGFQWAGLEFTLGFILGAVVIWGVYYLATGRDLLD